MKKKPKFKKGDEFLIPVKIADIITTDEKVFYRCEITKNYFLFFDLQTFERKVNPSPNSKKELITVIKQEIEKWKKKALDNKKKDPFKSMFSTVAVESFQNALRHIKTILP